MRNPQSVYRPVCAVVAAMALTTLVACNKSDSSMEAPPAVAPPMSAPAEAPPAAPMPPGASTEPAAPNTTMGEKVDDTVITTKVKAALLADEGVKGTDVSVTTVAGEVQLSGTVESQAQIDRAVEVAKGIEGVLRVQNGVTVKQ